MKVMMLIAHGSRNEAANEEVRNLAQRVERMSADEFDAVVTAFLEMAEPSIRQGVERCVELGAETITAVPYFLAAGNHVAVDIPRELKAAQAGCPGVGIQLSQYVGGDEAMARLVIASAKRNG